MRHIFHSTKPVRLWSAPSVASPLRGRALASSVCGCLASMLLLSGCAGSTFGTTFGNSKSRSSQEAPADPLVVSEVTIAGRDFDHPAKPPRELMEQLLGELSPEWQQRAAELTDAMTRLGRNTALGLTRSQERSAPPRFVVFVRDGELSLLRLGDDLRSDRMVSSLPMPGAKAKSKPNSAASAPSPKQSSQAPKETEPQAEAEQSTPSTPRTEVGATDKTTDAKPQTPSSGTQGSEVSSEQQPGSSNAQDAKNPPTGGPLLQPLRSGEPKM